MATEEQCRRALKVYRHQLLAMANVTGLGIRELGTADEKAGKTCLAVYVNAKIPREKLSAKDVIPRYLTLEEDENGTAVDIPTGVFEIGELELGQTNPVA